MPLIFLVIFFPCQFYDATAALSLFVNQQLESRFWKSIYRFGFCVWLEAALYSIGLLVEKKVGQLVYLSVE